MTQENTQNERPDEAANGGADHGGGYDEAAPGDAERAASAKSTESTESAESIAAALKREAEDFRDQSLRIAAELDNFRKRSARELENARKFGAERLAQALLPVRDSIEAGIAAAVTANTDAIVEGQRATLRLLDDALASAGVREIDPHGEPFDPAKHEALSMVPAPNLEPGSVVQVIQKGFEMHDRLLRAARVIVSQGA
jgi:molecular chaperone GrpE